MRHVELRGGQDFNTIEGSPPITLLNVTGFVLGWSQCTSFALKQSCKTAKASSV